MALRKRNLKQEIARTGETKGEKKARQTAAKPPAAPSGRSIRELAKERLENLRIAARTGTFPIGRGGRLGFTAGVGLVKDPSAARIGRKKTTRKKKPGTN